MGSGGLLSGHGTHTTAAASAAESSGTRHPAGCLEGVAAWPRWRHMVTLAQPVWKHALAGDDLDHHLSITGTIKVEEE
jgi:hypothetical protein